MKLVTVKDSEAEWSEEKAFGGRKEVRARIRFEDDELYEMAKRRVEEFHYDSLSDYVSCLVHMDVREDIISRVFLENLKQYYQDKNFTISTVADRSRLEPTVIVQLMREKLQFEDINASRENIKKINKELRELGQVDK